MEVCKVGGVAVRIHPTLLLLLAAYALVGLLTQALLVFLLVIGHELAHVVTAKLYGVRVVAMDIFPLGGTAQCEDSFEGRRTEESMIAIAGPLFNLLLLLFGQIMRWQGLWPGAWADDFIRINFWLAAFNLIPVLPLDGGRIVRAFFCGSFGFVRTTKCLAWAGRSLGIFLAVSALGMWQSQDIGAEPVFLMLLAAFFWLTGRKEIFTARLTFLRQLAQKKVELNNKGLMPVKWLTVRPETPLVRIVEKFIPDRYAMIALGDQHFALAKTFTETEILEGMFREGIHYPIAKL